MRHDVENIRIRREQLTEARLYSASDSSASAVWRLWSTAARIEQLRRLGWDWDKIRIGLGDQVGEHESTWALLIEQNPAHVGAAIEILHAAPVSRCDAASRSRSIG